MINKRPRPLVSWKTIDLLAAEITGWVSFKNGVDLEEEHSELLSANAVYIIRIKRPWAFSYKKKQSPVVYIGEGKAQQRISTHLRSWMKVLARELPQLKVQIIYCIPKLKGPGKTSACVEADLLHKFKEVHGELPLRNKQNELKYKRNYRYSRKTFGYLLMGKGRGFRFAISPMKSSGLYEASRKKKKNAVA